MAVSHLAVLNPVAEIGGAEISLLEILRRLGGRPRVSLILPEDGPLRTAGVAAGAAVRILPWPRRVMTCGERAGLPGAPRAMAACAAVPRLARGLARLLDELEADCVLTNGIKCHLLAAAARRPHGVPLLWYARDGLEGRRASKFLLRRCGRWCDGAIAISHYVAGEWRGVLEARAPIDVLYNIVDFDRHRPGLAPPADLPKRDGEIWYGVVGAVTPLKGQDLFLAASREVARVLPAARFFVVGGNFYRTEARLAFGERLRTAAEGAGLDGCVRFLGPRRDVPAIIANLDVLVQPNRGPEGLGRACLEAMAAAVPVVAVDRWGPAEVVSAAKGGLLAAWMDVGALAERMVVLGRDRALRQRLGRNGHAWVRRHLIADEIVDRFRACVDRAVSCAARKRAAA